MTNVCHTMAPVPRALEGPLCGLKFRAFASRKRIILRVRYYYINIFYNFSNPG